MRRVSPINRPRAQAKRVCLISSVTCTYPQVIRGQKSGLESCSHFWEQSIAPESPENQTSDHNDSGEGFVTGSKYQMVLVGKSPTSRRNSRPVNTTSFRSRVLSIIFQIHYLWSDIGPEKPRHTGFADNFLSIGIWVRSRWSRANRNLRPDYRPN